MDEGFRATDPWTSKAAARKVDKERREQQTLDELKSGGPGTSRQIARRLGIDLCTITPRLRPLYRKGLIIDDMTTMGEFGVTVLVWRAL